MKILAFDIGGTAIKYGFVDEFGVISDFNEIPTEAQKGGRHIMNTLLGIIGKKATEIDCIGVSTAGQVDSAEGKIIYANDNIPEYTGTEIRKIINEKYNIPVYVENDVSCAAVAEAHYGAGKGRDDFICLTYGTGVGGAMFINGRLYTGKNIVPEKFGHMVTHTGGIKCNCGGSGCYERYASASALTRRVESVAEKKLTGREIFSEKYFQKPEIKKAVDEWIDEIIGGLTSLVLIFKPPLVILGGGIMSVDYIIDEIKRKLKLSPLESLKSVEIKRAETKNRAGLLGAACLASEIFGE